MFTLHVLFLLRRLGLYVDNYFRQKTRLLRCPGQLAQWNHHRLSSDTSPLLVQEIPRTSWKLLLQTLMSQFWLASSKYWSRDTQTVWLKHVFKCFKSQAWWRRSFCPKYYMYVRILGRGSQKFCLEIGWSYYNYTAPQFLSRKIFQPLPITQEFWRSYCSFNNRYCLVFLLEFMETLAVVCSVLSQIY